MDIKITELSEKFIIYYTSDDYINIFTPLTNEETIDEFIKYDIPCKDCLVQSMCIKDRIFIDCDNKYRGINLKICEKLKRFIDKNRPLFLSVRLETAY